MNKLIIKLFAILVLVVFSNVSIAKPLKPQVTVLHSSSKSSAGESISYPKGTPKMTIAQVIFPVGGKITKAYSSCTPYRAYNVRGGYLRTS